MKLNRHIFLACALFIVTLLFLSSPLGAWDFGVLLNQESGYEHQNVWTYKGSVVPWFSTPLSDSADLYISLGASAELENNGWTFVPEIFRTELRYDHGNGEFKAGRMWYQDPLGLIANGLFDGLELSYDTSMGTFNVGAWYTGLLYKKDANITITQQDLYDYYEKVDYNNFSATYFAPRRLMAVLGWSHPGLAELVRLDVSLLGQADLSGANSLFHTQYLIANMAIPVQQFVFNAGGSFELIENGSEIGLAFAGKVGASWMTPVPIDDRLSLSGHFSSGTFEDSKVSAFIPISTVSQGEMLRAKLSGLSIISLDYSARLHSAVAASVSSSYYILSDLGTYQGLPSRRAGYFLGPEFFGRLILNPVSDIHVNLGGGVFLPSLGNAEPEAGLQWRIELSAIIALF